MNDDNVGFVLILGIVWFVIGIILGGVNGCKFRADMHCKAVNGAYTHRIDADNRIVCQSTIDVEKP